MLRDKEIKYVYLYNSNYFITCILFYIFSKLTIFFKIHQYQLGSLRGFPLIEVVVRQTIYTAP